MAHLYIEMIPIAVANIVATMDILFSIVKSTQQAKNRLNGEDMRKEKSSYQ